MSALTAEEAEVIHTLETKAKSLEREARKVGQQEHRCAERATAAFGEAAAILLDAAKNCGDLPRLVGVREASY